MSKDKITSTGNTKGINTETQRGQRQTDDSLQVGAAECMAARADRTQSEH